MRLLCGRAGRLTALFGGVRPGQCGSSRGWTASAAASRPAARWTPSVTSRFPKHRHRQQQLLLQTRRQRKRNGCRIQIQILTQVRFRSRTQHQRFLSSTTTSMATRPAWPRRSTARAHASLRLRRALRYASSLTVSENILKRQRGVQRNIRFAMSIAMRIHDLDIVLTCGGLLLLLLPLQCDGRWGTLSKGAKNTLLFEPFHAENQGFAKTGLGQR